MNNSKRRFALHITKDGKNNTFEDCDIQGAKIEGNGNKMRRTRIFNEFRKKHPTAFWLIAIGTVPVLIRLIIEYGFLK